MQQNNATIQMDQKTEELQSKLKKLKIEEREMTQYLEEAEGDYGIDDIGYLYSLRHQIAKLEAQARRKEIEKFNSLGEPIVEWTTLDMLETVEEAIAALEKSEQTTPHAEYVEWRSKLYEMRSNLNSRWSEDMKSYNYWIVETLSGTFVIHCYCAIVDEQFAKDYLYYALQYSQVNFLARTVIKLV